METGGEVEGCQSEVASKTILASNSAMENFLFRAEAYAGKRTKGQSFERMAHVVQCVLVLV